LEKFVGPKEELMRLRDWVADPAGLMCPELGVQINSVLICKLA